MGITIHWVDPIDFSMCMALLSVLRIKGSHTAVNIMEHLDSVMLEFALKCKTVRIVSDNAANMKKAFELQLEVPADGQEEQGQLLDVIPNALNSIDTDDEVDEV
jgi:hypothetical protein